MTYLLAAAATALIVCVPVQRVKAPRPHHGAHHVVRHHAKPHVKRRLHRGHAAVRSWKPKVCRMRCFTLASVPLVIVDEPDLLEPAAIDVGLLDKLMEMSGDEQSEGYGGGAGGGDLAFYGRGVISSGGGGGGCLGGSCAPCPPVSPVPEPASWAHLTAGLALCGWMLRKRERKMA